METGSKVRIKLVRSPIGYRQNQKDTVRALGLLKVQAERVVTITPHMLGMINTVKHLLEIEPVEDAE